MTGKTMGTATNIQVGARSTLSGMVRALVLALVVLIAGGLIKPTPMTVLAAIAVYVGLIFLIGVLYRELIKLVLKVWW